MGLSKRRKLFIIVFISFALVVMGISGNAQDIQPSVSDTLTKVVEVEQNSKKSEDNKIWTDENWKKAKEGIDYTKPEEKKKKDEVEEEEIKEETSPDTDEDFSVGEKLKNFFTSPWMKIIMLVVIIALLVFAIVRLFTGQNFSRDKKALLANELSLEDLEENPMESELDKFLRIALANGDYKTAVRILYLTVIQKLHTINYIKWKKDKTNSDYLNEMRTREGYKDFRNITLVYEVVWYGDKSITEPEYVLVQGAIESYNNKLNVAEETK